MRTGQLSNGPTLTCRLFLPPFFTSLSCLALKHGIDVGAGVIDSDYRGLLGVLLFNFGQEDFSIKPGDRIAQLVLERIETPDVQVVEVSEDDEEG